MTDDVTFTRAEVTAALPDWAKVSDCVAGESAIKAAQETYLPKPNPTDESDENAARYANYLARAMFYNATGRTLTGMMGLAFRKAPEVELPKNIEDLIDNIDGAGTPLFTEAHDLLEQVMKAGRAGLLTDYPITDGTVSRADQETIRPRVLCYPADSIINWRVDSSGRLALVVLYEVEEIEGEFELETADRFRELRMVEGVYTVRIWRLDEAGQPYVESEFVPLNAAGKVWTSIPFTFVGAIDNNPNLDRAPLFDLACVNVAHYRNSADYEDSVYMVGQPTPVFAGLDEGWISDVWDETVYLGSRTGIPLPEGGSATLLQAGPNTLAGEAMEKKEKQMISLGARLMTPGEAAKTAEQSRAETAAAHSPLSLACWNISIAMTQALTWANQFDSRTESEVDFEISTDFAGLIADANLIKAIVEAWQKDAIPTSDKNAAMRSIGMIQSDKSDQDIADEIEAEGGGLGLEDLPPAPPQVPPQVPPEAPPAGPE